MPVKIETFASIIAIVISLGTIFYHGVVVKRDVEHLTVLSEKRENLVQANVEKINTHENEIHLLKSDIKFSNDKVEEINKQITELHKAVLESSQETRKLLIQTLVGK